MMSLKVCWAFFFDAEKPEGSWLTETENGTGNLNTTCVLEVSKDTLIIWEYDWIPTERFPHKKTWSFSWTYRHITEYPRYCHRWSPLWHPGRRGILCADGLHLPTKSTNLCSAHKKNAEQHWHSLHFPGSPSRPTIFFEWSSPPKK